MYYRATQTKEQIIGAFYALLKEKAAKDITVSEVCEKAQLNRTTFYKHFKNCDDIIAGAEQEQLDKYRALLSDKEKTYKEVLISIFDSIDEARELNRLINGTEMSDHLRNGLIAISKEFGLQEWKNKLPKVDELSAEISYEALLAGILHAVLAMGDRVSSEKKASLILDMIDAYIQSRS